MCACVCVCVYIWITLLYIWNTVNILQLKKKKDKPNLILQWLKIKIVAYSFLYSHLVVVVQLVNCVWLLRPHGLLLPGSSVQGVPQARILEWVAISFFSFSRGSSWPRDQTLVSYMQVLYHWATREALYCKLRGRFLPPADSGNRTPSMWL